MSYDIEEKYVSLFSEEQDLVIDYFNSGYNMFITGPGGSGKSHIIKYITNNSKKRISVTAMTGCAALVLDCDATTLHSWSGIGFGIKDVEQTIKNIKKNKMKSMKWKSVDVLIIDEVSMLPKTLFEQLNIIAKSLRKNDNPFGGIQLILSGDFYQLPPIDDDYCFLSDAWKECVTHTVNLKTIFRQTDKKFQEFLNKVRIGHVDEDVEKILKRCVKKDDDATRLFPTRNGIDEINDKELEKIEEEEYIYVYKFNKEDIEQVELMNKKYPYKTTLTLKEGSKVMLIVNLNILSGLVNGSQGEVKVCGKDFVIVKFYNGIEETIRYHEWISEEKDKNKKVVVKMIPLILSYALSIHKSQGMSLDKISVDIGNKIFTCGQIYTALSRVKSIDGLSVLRFNTDKIQADPIVTEFYEKLTS
jgi:ATP-dependent DNA helicase PIF1